MFGLWADHWCETLVSGLKESWEKGRQERWEGERCLDLPQKSNQSYNFWQICLTFSQGKEIKQEHKYPKGTIWILKKYSFHSFQTKNYFFEIVLQEFFIITTTLSLPPSSSFVPQLMHKIMTYLQLLLVYTHTQKCMHAGIQVPVCWVQLVFFLCVCVFRDHSLEFDNLSGYCPWKSLYSGFQQPLMAGSSSSRGKG